MRVTVPATNVPVEAPEVRTGDAFTANGETGGGYSIQIPKGWVMFTEQRQNTPKGFPRSVRIHYVSQDGRYQLLVERFLGFYTEPAHKIADYRAALKGTWPENYVEKTLPLDKPPGPGGPEPAQQLLYRTAEGDQRRTTFADIIPRDSDLWAISVSVPTVEEDDGKAKIFDVLAPSFTFT